MIDTRRKQLEYDEAFNITAKLLLKGIGDIGEGLTREQRSYYKACPVEFVREVLGCDPYDRQEEIINSVRDNTRTTVRSSHGIGKTWDAAIVILWFISCFVPSSVVTTAPTGRQVRGILWEEIKDLYYKAKIPIGGRLLQTQLNMSDKEKWFALGFSTDEHNLDSFQGFHNDNILVVVDEASGVGGPIYDAIEGLLSSGVTVRLLLIGNPLNEQSVFGESFKSPLYKGKYYLSAFDSPNFTEFGITIDDIRKNSWQSKITGPLPRPYLVTPDWVYGRYLDWGEDDPRFFVRVKGEFPPEEEDTFIPLLWVEKSHLLEATPYGKRILGIDIGGLGRDQSAATMRQEAVVSDPIIWHHKNPMESAGIIANLINDLEPDIVNIDVIGEGSGVVYRLKELGYNVNGVNVANTSRKPEHYFNLRAELAWEIRNRLRDDRLMLPKDDMLDEELIKIKSDSLTSKGQLKLELKEKTKARIGRSPDRFDSLMLTMYEPSNEAYVSEDIAGLVSQDTTYMDKVYKTDMFIYNKDISIICPECGYGEGMISYIDNGVEKTRCFICKGLNLENIVKDKEGRDASYFRE